MVSYQATQGGTSTTGRVYRLGPVRNIENTADYLVPVWVETVVVDCGCARFLRVIGNTCDTSQVEVTVEIEECVFNMRIYNQL